MKRQSEIIKEDNVPLSFGFIFVNWRFYMCQVTKICSDIQINKNMCHYWNDFNKFTWNEFGFKSDRPLLIANCCTIKLFTMCPVLVRSTHFHNDYHRRGVLSW